MRFSLLASVCGLALGVSGCAVGPDWTGGPELAMPAAWSEGAKTARPMQAAALGEWWKDFRDPLLNRLIDKAVAGNLDVASAKAKIREARAARRQTQGALQPTLDGTASATREQTSPALSPGAKPYTLFVAGFDASWELDLFGANRRADEAATHAEAASEQDLRTTLLTLVGDVTSYYVEARGDQAQIALARSTAESQRKTAALTRTKFQVGAASAIDTAKADATAETTEADIPTYQTAYAEAVHRLSVLTGEPPATLNKAMSAVKPIPDLRKPLPTGIPADVLKNRPDVKAAEERLAQYTASVGQAEAALYPSVSLSGAISSQPLKLGDLGKASTIAWSYGPSVNIPIFHGGQLVAARDEAQAVRDQYFIAWKSSVLTALEDVENDLVALKQERIKLKKLEESAKNYQSAADLSNNTYANGSASFLDVLDAERYLYTAQGSAIQSRVAVATDTIALSKALGGGWTKPVDASKPEIVDQNTGPHIEAVKAADGS